MTSEVATAVLPRAAVLGESLVDVVRGRMLPGGSPLNVAVGLSRLGIPTVLHTRIGDDEAGHVVANHLAASGVSLAPGATVSSPTSTARAMLAADGSAEYEFDVIWDLPRPEPDGATIVHVGSIGAFVAPGAEVVRKTLACARGAAMTSFDPNIRSALVGDRTAAVARTEALAGLSHIVKLSEEDAAWLYPDTALENVLAGFGDRGAQLVVITLGAAGCIARAGGRVFRIAAERVVVADTIGAGDAFMSGLLAAIARSGSAQRVRAGGVTDAEWHAMLDVALASAAITVSRTGADPPWSRELPLATAPSAT